MNVKTLNINAAATFLACCYGVSACAQTMTPDLRAIRDGKGWKGSLSATKLIEIDGAPAIEFNQRGQNVVWLEGVEFKEGTVEFDAKGKSAPPQRSFVGLAFRVVNQKTHDAVYFRPFNFRSTDADRKAHSVQYVSEPEWPWHRLRKEQPGQFEKPIDPAPDGDAWFHVKVILDKRRVIVFVNDAADPSLVVNELSDRAAGSVGLWCNGYGVISNLRITPAK